MLKVNFPDYDFKLRIEKGQKQIFDPVRKKYVKITPEEWVRQHWLHFLNKELNYPFGLLAVEKGISLNGMHRRCDIVAYSKQGAPILIVECKAPEVQINQKSIDQAARYNITLKVPYLLITNGTNYLFFCVNHKASEYSEKEYIPMFDDLIEYH